MKGRPVYYTADELAFIQARAHEPRATIHAAFVVAFGRDDVRVCDITALCKRKKWPTPRERWTEADDATLRARYPHESTARLATAMGRTVQACYRRALTLGLKKDAAYLQSAESGRILPGSDLGTRTRWKPGYAPKHPKRGKGWAPGRMGETQFRRERPSWNAMPIGSERIKAGYRWVKVRDTRNVPWTENWRELHRVRWEAAHGPIPEGHALLCRDGDRTNCDPSNWTPVPRALLPRLNGGKGKQLAYHHAPAELQATVLAVAQLVHAARTRKPKERAA